MGKYGLNERIAEDKTRCIAGVWNECGWGSHQCQRKRGHGKDGLYCKQHDPAKIVAKRKETEEKYRQSQEKRRASYERAEILAGMANGIKTKDLVKFKLVLK